MAPGASKDSYTQLLLCAGAFTLHRATQAALHRCDVSRPVQGNLLACPNGDLAYLDFGMMSAAPENARYAIVSLGAASLCTSLYAGAHRPFEHQSRLRLWVSAVLACVPMVHATMLPM